MKVPVQGVLVTAVLGLCASSAFADGNVSCSEQKADWKPRVELQKMLKRDGWAVRDIRITNGCYEVYGFDGSKARVEVFFNPKTFERVWPADEPAAAGAR